MVDLFSRYEQERVAKMGQGGRKVGYLLSLAEHVCSKKGNVV